jgi:hypothetical protein
MIEGQPKSCVELMTELQATSRDIDCKHLSVSGKYAYIENHAGLFWKATSAFVKVRRETFCESSTVIRQGSGARRI